MLVTYHGANPLKVIESTTKYMLYLSITALLLSSHVQMAQSVYGLVEEGTQSQSPIHTPSHHCRKGTKEDVEKEVRLNADYC